MKIENAINAALSAMNRVTDATELASIREPFDALRNSTPFIEFLDSPVQSFPFRSEFAHVVSKVSGKSTSHVRRLQRSLGRESFSIPALRLEAHAPRCLLSPDHSQEEDVKRMARQLPQILGGDLAGIVEAHMLLPLLAAAEEQQNVRKSTAETVMADATDAVNELGAPSTLIVSWEDAALVTNHPKFEWQIGRQGKVVPTRAIAKNVMLAVANEPGKVGLVRVETEPQAFIGLTSTCTLDPVAICNCGFCVWGDAPVIKIDLR